jgi:hypothetical protein
MIRGAATAWLPWALLAGLAGLAHAQELFSISDPAGDDHGAGAILYPDRGDLFPGDLDLLRLGARAGDGGTWFTARFRNPLRDPAGEVTEVGQAPLEQLARLGFYTLNLDLYIDRDRVPESGFVDTLPGRRITLRQEHAWDRAVILVPRPQMARARFEEYLSLRIAADVLAMPGRKNKRRVEELFAATLAQIDEHYYFPEQVRVRGREIEFFVPDGFLGGPARADWSYTVLVTGADVQQSARAPNRGIDEFSLMMLPLAQGRRYDRFGVPQGADAEQPPVIDWLMPAEGVQARFLGDYDSYAGRNATLPGVVPADPAMHSVEPPAAVAGEPSAAPAPAVRLRLDERGVTSPRPPAPSPAGPAAQPAPAAPEAGAPRTLVERLKALNDLREEGLISESEYLEARRRILSEI